MTVIWLADDVKLGKYKYYVSHGVVFAFPNVYATRNYDICMMMFLLVGIS